MVTLRLHMEVLRLVVAGESIGKIVYVRKRSERRGSGWLKCWVLEEVLVIKMEEDGYDGDSFNQALGNFSKSSEAGLLSAEDVLKLEFGCPKEAIKQDRKREQKVVTRCGCLAEMRIKPNGETGKWFVSRFVDDHNHELLPKKFVEYLPSYRKVSDVDIAHMDSLRQVGISIPKIYKSFAA
ncbi:hypothetical protein AHAS_Ahas08G0036400 [Arachis hypogaea]